MFLCLRRPVQFPHQGVVPNSRRLPSEGRSCRCKSCHPDQFLLRCRLISRTADFESVNGGASPPAAAIFRVASFNSEAAGSYPAELGALPRRPTILARWRSSQRSSLIRRRSQVQLLLEPPVSHNVRVRERTSATGPPQAECEAPSAMSASQSARAPIFRSVAEQQMQRAVNATP